MKKKLTVEVDEKTEAILSALGSGAGQKTAQETLEYIVSSVVDGVRRPGSWERQLLPSLFGEGVSRAEDAAERYLPFAEVLCICGHLRSKHADTLDEPCASDECKLCDCRTFEPLE